MNSLEKVKNLNKRISLLKESIIPANWHSSWKEMEKLSSTNFNILNEDVFFDIIKYAIKNQLEDYEDESENPETDPIVRFKNWLFPSKNKIRYDALQKFIDISKIRLFSDMIRKVDTGINPSTSRPPIFDESSFKTNCKVRRMTDGGSFSCASTFINKGFRESGNVLLFFNFGFVVKLRYAIKEFESEEIEQEIDWDNLDIDDFFSVHSNMSINVNSRLMFHITKKDFSLNKIPNEVFDYIDKSVLYHREYIPKLQEIGKELTEAKFEDTIKSQKVGRVLSRL